MLNLIWINWNGLAKMMSIQWLEFTPKGQLELQKMHWKKVSPLSFMENKNKNNIYCKKID